MRQLHSATQLIFKRALNADIDGQGDGRAASCRVGQMVVEDLLHPHAASAVRSDVSQDMSRHLALRIMTVFFHRHLERKLANILHLVGLFGKQTAP